jgi:DNA-directed RNA polymerase specialized sigma24 family protein
MTEWPEVVETAQKHPDWCADEIAVHLDCSAGYVRSTLMRKRVVVRSRFERRYDEDWSPVKPRA